MMIRYNFPNSDIPFRKVISTPDKIEYLHIQEYHDGKLPTFGFLPDKEYSVTENILDDNEETMLVIVWKSAYENRWDWICWNDPEKHIFYRAWVMKT